MNTQEIIKETEVETSAMMETAAGNIQRLIGMVRELREEVKTLHDANFQLREKIAKFKNWTSDEVGQIDGTTLRATAEILKESFSGDKTGRISCAR